MSRFTGWTAEAVAKLEMKNSGIDLLKTKRKLTKKITADYSGQIAAALRILGIECETEYRFLKDRRFRFDVAVPQHHIAIEFEGGVFTSGRHTRGAGYVRDSKKYNLATMHGWKLLRYTTDITTQTNWEFKVADEVKQLIEGKTKCK